MMAIFIIRIPFMISQNVYGGSIGSFNSIIVTLLAFPPNDLSPPFLSITAIAFEIDWFMLFCLYKSRT